MALQQQFESAMSHHQAGRLAEAEAVYRQIIAQQPDFAEAHSNLGNVLRNRGEFAGAIESCQRAVSLKPDLFAAYNNLGNALVEAGRLGDGIAAFRRAIEIAPNVASIHYNLGNALKEAGDWNGAIESFRDAIALQPELAEAHNNLGTVLKDAGQLEEAVDAYSRAIKLHPNYAEAHNNLGSALKAMGQLDEAIAAFEQAMRLRPGFAEAHSNLIYTLHFHPASDAQTLLKAGRSFNERHAESLKKMWQPHGNDRDADHPLRIGYVSPDFCEHPVGRFLLPLLAAHSTDQFSIFGYSDTRRADEMTGLLRRHIPHWRDTGRLTHAQLAQLICDDRVDVLVDLAMHAAGNRMLVFARKPAPVQVTYLAYCSTTGLDAMDYRLTDPYLDPPGAGDAMYSERSIHLPDTYWCYPRNDLAGEIAPPPSISAGAVTFGCFNNFSKVSSDSLSLWIELLRKVAKSRLLLLAHEGRHRDRIRDSLKRAGVDPARLRFVGRTSLSEYFKLHAQVDIALDPFPYTGGTTTCDALWMGVPVVTLRGRTGVGRSGVSILSNVGLKELIAESPEQYVQIAAELAEDTVRLNDLRRTLRARMSASPLMDAPRFARDIEAAYRRMWQNWCTDKL